MMLAVQHGLVALRIVFVDLRHLRRRGLWLGQRLPLAVAHPRALLPAGILDVEEAHGLAVLLELVLHLAFERERLGPGQVDAPILEFLAVVDAHGHEAAGLGVVRVAGPLEHGDGAQLRRVFVGVGDLAGILRARRERSGQRGSYQRRCRYPQASWTPAMTLSTHLDNNRIIESPARIWRRTKS